MYDVINNLYNLIVSFQMETGNMTDRSNKISISIGLQNVMDRYGTDQKAIRYNENIVLIPQSFVLIIKLYLHAGNKAKKFCNLWQYVIKKSDFNFIFKVNVETTLHEMCPNTKFFLVLIFL